MADLGQEFVAWLKTYKNIARWIGYIIGASIGFAAVAATISLVSGAMGLLKVGAIAAFAPIRGLLSLMSLLGKPLVLIRSAIMLIFAGFKTLISVVWAVINPLKMLRLVFAFAFSPLSILLLAGLAIYKFRHQLKDLWNGLKQGFGSIESHLAPVYHTVDIVKSSIQKVMATIGRIAGLFNANAQSALAFQDVGVTVGQALGFVFDVVLNAIELIARSFGFMADVFAISIGAMIDGWNAITALWDSNKPIESFLNIASELGKIFSRAFKGIVNAFTDVINFIIEKANNLPGINIPLIPKWEDSTLPMKGSATAVGASIGAQALQMQNQIGTLNTTSPKFELSEQTKPQFTKMPSGSVSKAITQNQQTTITIIYGGVTINSNDGNKVWQDMRNR